MIWLLAVCIVLVFIGLFIFYMYTEATRNTIVEHEIAFPHFPKGFGEVRIFFISDIHKRAVAESLVEQAKGKADIVIIGGDLAERGVPLKRIARNIQLLREIGPLYFVWGNNDYEIDYHELDALLLDHKVIILDNTRAVFESEEGEKLILLGVDDVGLGRDRLDLALSDCEEEGFRILVSHSPSITRKFTDEERISLVLSGHTHGGQIRMFHHTRFLKGGVYRREHTTLFVSNGYGTTVVPLRFRAPAQTHIITLKNHL
ncbi:metallophosphoesterase [Ectobacillus panaciterrae]|uniref:metallophosphoesterase n=1 Tax=Ectobacillus panaciterrae TaxID=363872 RepID=UPI0004124BA2|nr:metallophosphoesterase [Ectobacillus panaciterrae]